MRPTPAPGLAPGPAPDLAPGPAVVFDAVSLTLGRTPVLDAITLRVAPGSLHAVVGPNGGGKSSLLKALLGQVAHRGGIHLDWPAGNPPGTIAYVPQTISHDPGLPMTVTDFLALLTQRRPAFLSPRRAMRTRIMTALDRVGMADKAGRRFGALSGGERQRVLLAQALLPSVSGPAAALVILDEPMTALDEAGAALFAGLLADWRAAGATVLWVEHDLAAVRRLADRATALNRAVIADGRPEEVLAPERLLGLFAAGRPLSAPAPGLRVAS